MAISYSNGRVAPVLDVSERFVLIKLNGNDELERKEIQVLAKNLQEKVEKLAELKLNLLICGAVSAELQDAIVKKGIMLMCFCCGDLESFIHAFLEGSLNRDDFLMPGCCRKRYRQRYGYCHNPRKNTKKGGI